MKRTLYICITATIITMMLSACNNDTDYQLQVNTLPVEVTTAIPTRATVKKEFTAGDCIVLTTNHTAANPAQVAYTLNTDNTWTPGGNELLLPATGHVAITATYTATNPDNLHANDLQKTSTFADDLTAAASTQAGTIVQTQTQANVTLNFTHNNALIVLGTVTDEKNATIAPDDITNIDIYITATAGSKYRINMQGNTPEAIAPAEATINSITVTLASGITCTATTATTATTAANTQYELNMRLTATAATFTVDESNTWGWSVQPEKDGYYTKVPGYDYTITSVADLIAFRKAVYNSADGNVTAIQVANITFDENDASWIPIGYNEDGSDRKSFTGTYNGNGYTITGLRIIGDYSQAGFFGYVSNAVLTGIHLRGVEIDNTKDSASYTGALAGSATVSAGGSYCISLCSAQGTVKGKGLCTGGLIGYASGIHITRCRTNCECEVSSDRTFSDTSTGGLVGQVSNCTLVACQAQGGVTAQAPSNISAGGLVGRVGSTTTIYCCRATGSVTATATSGGSACAGGLVGSNYASISNSYATGNATATGGSSIYAGSLVGSNSGTLTNCHASGSANGHTTPIGRQDGTGTAETTPATRNATVRNNNTPQLANTTVWQAGDPYSTTVESKTFAAAGVWSNDNLPQIKFDYNGN